MYVPMSVPLGPRGVPSDVIRKRRARRVVTWFVSVHVSRGYMVCTMDSDRRKELARLRQRRHTYHMLVPRSCENECCAIPRVAGSASFNAVAFLVSI